MTPVGPEGESGIPQAAKVAHALPIGWPAKLRVLQDCFFQLGVAIWQSARASAMLSKPAERPSRLLRPGS